MRHLWLLAGLAPLMLTCGTGSPKTEGALAAAPVRDQIPDGVEQPPTRADRVRAREESPAAPTERVSQPEQPEPAPIPQGRPPPPDPFSLYAVAYHHVTQVRAEPGRDADVIGYIRRGTKFKVKPRVSRRGCSRGWHEVRGGGYVCDGLGVNVAADPVDFEPSPVAARLDAALPYAYGSITRDGTLSFFRIPTPEEEQAAERAVAAARLPSVQEAVEDSGSQASATEAPTETTEAPPEATSIQEGADTPAPPADETQPAASVEARDPETPAERAAEAAAAATSPRPAEGRALPELVEAVLLRGFFLSVDTRVADSGRVFYRTVRHRFVRADRVIPATAPTYHGVRIGEDRDLPVAFLTRGGIHALRRRSNGTLRTARRLSRLTTFFPEQEADSSLLRMRDGTFVRKDAVVLVEHREPPAGLRDGEKWIDVDLATQTLVAYEGTKPVFATLVSTGREGHETPRGTYRIQSKHVSATMDDPTSPDDAYSIEDVPWTMYLKDSLALHGAFWHRNFGTVRSHGCVNLSPADARWIFLWSDPPVADGLHGVFVRPGRGTRVVIH